MAAKILAFPQVAPRGPRTQCERHGCQQPHYNESTWCHEHQFCGELLRLAAVIGYPELQLTAHIFVQRGREQWHYFAKHFYALRHREQALAAMTKEHERLKGTL